MKSEGLPPFLVSRFFVLPAAIGLAGTVIFFAIPHQLLHLFSAGGAMIALGVPALRIIAPSLIPASVTMVIGYTISGLGNGMVHMLSTACRQLVLLIPCVLLFGALGGIRMIWFACWVSELCALVFAAVSLRREFQKKL
ncbi:MAG: MATE family efflux transporter [Butyricicoccus sp.]